MGPSDDMTLHEAAELLGVHYMTVYRYVRLGMLPAVKSGGVWQVHRSDVEALRSNGGPAREADGSAPWSDRLEQRLIAGDGSGAWSVVEAALASGASVDEVYLNVLSPALSSIGERWEQGAIDVSIEHRASGIAHRLVGRLGPRFVRRGRSRGVVVIGGVQGEMHSLPLAMVGDLARQQGWEVSDLGPDVPVASFVHAVTDVDGLAAVALGVMTSAFLDEVAVTCAALREVLPLGVPIIVGGRAITTWDEAAALGADEFAADGREFTAILDRLSSAQSLVG